MRPIYTKKSNKKRKRPKSPLQVAKDKAWNAYARYIKLRDCLITTGTKEYCDCITCGKKVQFGTRYLHAGHFIPGRGNAVLFVEELCHGQCLQCNFYKDGNQVIYREKMVKIYGEKKVQEFEQLRHATKKYTKDDYEEIERYYNEEFESAYANN